jgi:succinate dehydrogenase / fumarate reductase flavoprotein subunit
MQAAVNTIRQLRQRYRSVRVQDTGKQFNTDLLELIELGNLLDLSLITAASALNRQESRGATAGKIFRARRRQLAEAYPGLPGGRYGAA